MNLGGRKKQRILVVKIGAIGDVLMTTPALRALRKREPDADIYYLVGKRSAPVLACNHNINRLIEVTEEDFSEKRAFNLFKLLLNLRRLKFDKVYILHRDISYYVFLSFLFVPVNGFRRRVFPMLPIFGEDRFRDGQHHIRNYLDLFGGGDDISCNLDFPVPANIGLPDILSEMIGSGKEVIVINPGGGINHGERVAVRRWPANHYAGLVLKIAESYGDRFIFLFSGLAEEFSLAEDIICLIKEQDRYLALHNIAGLTNLSELRLLLNSVSCFITGDTGGMHIASSANIPILSIFGPTDPLEKAPLNSCSLYLKTGVPCAPCYSGKFKGCSNFICMDDISADKAFISFQTIAETNEGSHNT